MKVLGIVGGAKRNGNTVKLVEEVMAGAKEVGHETVLLKLVDMNIGHLCDRDGDVSFPEDDFEKIKPHIESMSALVLGAPIWYDFADSRSLTFITRLYYYNISYSEQNNVKWPKKAKAVNVITYQREDMHFYDHILEWLEHIWKWYSMTSIIGLVAEGTGSRPVERRIDLLKRAREIGRKLWSTCAKIIIA